MLDFFKSLIFKYGTKKIRYAAQDYNLFFEQHTINGIPLERRYLGKLTLSSGFVVACDPLLGLHDALPFTRRIPTGEYPVYMVLSGSGHHKKNTLIKLSFSDKRAVRWELAMVPGQSSGHAYIADVYYGFTVDAGIGCICDAHTQKHYNSYLERFFKDHPNGNIYDSLFASAFARNGMEENHSFNFYLPARPQLNVIMFHTGYGDGIYPAYWGLSEDGEVCSLVIDFMVL